jgi:hypothetical protein
MGEPRRRRGRLVVLLIVGGIVAAVVTYRDRTLRRRSTAFDERYGA